MCIRSWSRPDWFRKFRKYLSPSQGFATIATLFEWLFPRPGVESGISRFARQDRAPKFSKSGPVDASISSSAVGFSRDAVSHIPGSTPFPQFLRGAASGKRFAGASRIHGVQIFDQRRSFVTQARQKSATAPIRSAGAMA